MAYGWELGSPSSKTGPYNCNGERQMTEIVIRAIADLIANATITLLFIGALWAAGYRIKFERRDVDKSSGT